MLSIVFLYKSEETVVSDTAFVSNVTYIYGKLKLFKAGVSNGDGSSFTVARDTAGEAETGATGYGTAVAAAAGFGVAWIALIIFAKFLISVGF